MKGRNLNGSLLPCISCGVQFPILRFFTCNNVKIWQKFLSYVDGTFAYPNWRMASCMRGYTCQGYSPDMVGISTFVLAAPSFWEHTLPQASQSISTNAQYVTLQTYFSHPSFQLLTFFFPTPPIKLKLGLQVGGRLTTNSNPLGSIKLSTQSETGSSKYNKIQTLVFIRLFQGSESCAFSEGPSSLRVYSLDLTDEVCEPHRRFPVQGHILSIGGDALYIHKSKLLAVKYVPQKKISNLGGRICKQGVLKYRWIVNTKHLPTFGQRGS